MNIPSLPNFDSPEYTEALIAEVDRLRAELAGVKAASKLGADQYGLLFEYLPLGVLEEDYSAVKIEVDKLISGGVDNLHEYLCNNPDRLRKLAASVKIVNLNPALLKMYRAESKQDFIDDQADIENWWCDQWIDYYAHEIASLAKTNTCFGVERDDIRIDDSRFTSRVHSFLVAGHEDSWERVVTIHEDITRRKEMEAQLRENRKDLEFQIRERTRALTESETLLAQNAKMANLGYAIWNYKKGIYTTVSEEFAEIYGYTQKEFLAEVTDIDKDEELIHVDDRECYKAHYRDRAKDELTPNIELRIIRRDGQIRHILESSRNLFDESGEIDQSFFSIQDITERKQEEERLQQREYWLSESQRAGNIGSYALDILSDTWISSAVMDQIFGLEPQARKTLESWSTLVHAEDREELLRYFSEDVLEAGNSFDREYRITRASDGVTRWVWGLGELTFNSDGKPVKMLGTVQDITERKLREIWDKHRETVMTMLSDRIPMKVILDRFLCEIEAQNPGAVCAVLLLDHDGERLLHGAAPSLPGYFIQGIDGLAVDAEAGPCGSVSGTGKRVIVEDIGTHPHWAAYLELANRAGLRSCWSLPIISGDSKVAGSFSIYHEQPGTPTPDDLKLMEDAAFLIAQVIDRSADFKKLQLAASVYTHTHEGIAITDATGSIIDVNDAFIDITGYSRKEVIGQNPRILKSGRQGPEFYAAMWKSINENGHWTGEVWNRKKDGEVYAELLSISAVRDDSGIVQHYVALFSDITAAKNHQQELEYLAHYDALTDLPNRLLFSDRLNQSIIQSQRRGLLIAVAYLDLDGFKAINDINGHETGDKLLIAVSRLIKNVLREGDTLARMGGDEFVMVLADLKSPQDCVPLLERIMNALSADPLVVDDTVCRITASIGVAIYPQDDVDADILLRHADQAMYQAKQAGKNQYHLFDTEQDAAIQTQRENLNSIRLALDRREFVLYYQPKVNMKSGNVIGAEALIRWQHPERGLLSPITFLPTIENHRLGIEVGEWVIDTALRQMSEWHSTGLDISVSVNISASQLQSSGFASRLAGLLAAYPGVRPGSLELEVLETSALEDIEQVSRIMYACMETGVHFALDDFGTGYSSLTYLKRLPVEVLKIDQSFIRDMLDNGDDLAIVEGVIGLARAFHRQAIAEGVETVAHGVQLLAMGCEQAQGYGIARPMPAADLVEWAGDWQPDEAWASS